MGKHDAENGTAVLLELAGKTYTWQKPNMRVARSQAKDMLKIWGVIERVKFDKDGKALDRLGNVQNIIDSLDACLDFFYTHNIAIAEDRDHIDAFSPGDEIQEAFNRVVGLLSDPLGFTPNSTKKRSGRSSKARAQNTK